MKEVYQGRLHRLCNILLHYFYGDLGDSESQKSSLCQPFSVASFPREGRVSCTPVIRNRTRTWWEPWPASVRQKRLGRLGSVLAPAPTMISRGELRNTAPPKKRLDAFSHKRIFSRNQKHSLLGRANYCSKRACAGGQTLLSFEKHFCHLKCTWNSAKDSNCSFFFILEGQDTI